MFHIKNFGQGKTTALAVPLLAVMLFVLFMRPAWAAKLNAADAFNAIAYNGSTGTAPWAGNWTELGENNGTGSGLVRVVNSTACAAPNCLRLGGSGVIFSGRGLSRAVNLAGASQATLGFSYKRQGINRRGTGSVQVQVSSNGLTWTTLGSIAFTATTDAGQILASYNIAPALATANTRIRFYAPVSVANLLQRGYLFIDNVSVAFERNAPPVANADRYSAMLNVPLTVAAPGVLANDSDPEGAALTAAVVTRPASGTLSFNGNGSFTYTPTAAGTVTFTYRASDGASTSTAATVSIDVAAANTNGPPVFSPATYNFPLKEDAVVGTTVGKVSASDPENNMLSYAIVTDDSGGLFALAPNSGAITVAAVPAGKFRVGQTKNLAVQVKDPAGLAAQATVVVSIIPADKLVDLKLLVISTGTPAEDPGLDLIDDLLKQMGVPYDVFDSCRTTLTEAGLRHGENANHARYYGVILTDAETKLGASHGAGDCLAKPDKPESVGLGLAEWQTLHEFERYFGIRESVISGWPATNPSLDLNYGMQNFAWGSGFKAKWQAPAGGTEVFEYVKPASSLPVSEWSYPAQPAQLHPAAPGENGPPTVEPLLVCDPSDTKCPSGYTFVSRLRYHDGREVLLSTITNAWWDTESQVLAYEFVNFATKGVFMGSRQAHLAAHVDDLFLPDDLWDMNSNTTPGTLSYLATADDIKNLADQQRTFIARHPTAAGFKLDFAFNGEGVGIYGNPLGNNRDAFAYINHTYSHMDMDVTAQTSYDMAYSDIAMNRDIWQSLTLPDYDANVKALVTGDHSGIMDDGTVPATPFPDGANPAFLQAAQYAGVRYLASNASQPNQAEEQFVTAKGVNYDLLLLPRYPTNVFYNVTNPEELLDEYNWIFYDSYVNEGIDPCSVPAAICSRRANYGEILEAEADIALRHMVSYKDWPHFFHMSNVKNYSAGKTLVFDWLDKVVTRYEQIMRLPLKNLRFYDIGKKTGNRVAARSASLIGQWDLTTNQVTLSADKPVTLTVTGMDGDATGQCTGGELYGGQCQLPVDLGTTPKTLYVNQGLSH